MATWPASLPTAQRRGHGYEVMNAQTGVRFASGNTRRRQATSVPREVFDVSWLLSQAQLDALDAFWQGDGDFGAATIDGMKIKDTEGVSTSGSGGAPSVRIISFYRPEIRGPDLFFVAAKVERTDDNQTDEETYFSDSPILWQDGEDILWEDDEVIHWE